MSELLFRDDAYLKTTTARVVAVGERGIELDRTIFYPLGGGQPGDTGVLVRANGDRIAIADTRKGEGLDGVVHVPAPERRAPGSGRRGDARARLGAALCADAAAHRAARDVVRRRRAGDRRQHRARQARASISTST